MNEDKKLSGYEKEQPADPQPDEKEGECYETSIDGTYLGQPQLKEDIPRLDELKRGGCDGAREECGAHSDRGAWHRV